MAAVVEKLSAFEQAFETSDKATWLDESIRHKRTQAFARFQELGIPHAKLEDWRNTSLRQFEETEFSTIELPSPTEMAAIERALPTLSQESRIVFIDGHYSPQLTRLEIDSITAGAFSEAGAGELAAFNTIARWNSEAFVALNTALVTDGAFVIVPRGVMLESPIHIIHVATDRGAPSISFGRTIIELQEGASASVVESICSLGDRRNCLCVVTEAIVEQGAKLEHVKLQVGSETAIYITELEARVDSKGEVRQINVTLGGGLVRNATNATLAGDAATASLNGLYIARGTQHVDNHTTLDHCAPNCPSHELYKGILSDAASGVFRGKIIVRPDAQKTDSKQSSMTMLLSDRATVNAKPQLEIFADDVRCTHGATIGQLPEDQVFYLRARGIDREAAQHLLTYAFASDVIETIGNEALRDWLERAIFERFASDGRLPSADELHS